MQTITNLDAPIVNFRGEELIDGNAESTEKEFLTPKKVICRALITATPDGAPGDEKAAIDIICRRVWEAGDEIELESADVQKIRDAVGKVYPPPVVGPVYELLK